MSTPGSGMEGSESKKTFQQLIQGMSVEEFKKLIEAAAYQDEVAIDMSRELSILRDTIQSKQFFVARM